MNFWTKLAKAWYFALVVISMAGCAATDPGAPADVNTVTPPSAPITTPVTVSGGFDRARTVTAAGPLDSYASIALQLTGANSCTVYAVQRTSSYNHNTAAAGTGDTVVPGPDPCKSWRLYRGSTRPLDGAAITVVLSATNTAPGSTNVGDTLIFALSAPVLPKGHHVTLANGYVCLNEPTKFLLISSPGDSIFTSDNAPLSVPSPATYKGSAMDGAPIFFDSPTSAHTSGEFAAQGLPLAQSGGEYQDSLLVQTSGAGLQFYRDDLNAYITTQAMPGGWSDWAHFTVKDASTDPSRCTGSPSAAPSASLRADSPGAAPHSRYTVLWFRE